MVRHAKCTVDPVGGRMPPHLDEATIYDLLTARALLRDFVATDPHDAEAAADLAGAEQAIALWVAKHGAFRAGGRKTTPRLRC
jgi:hypothetical protein